MIKRVVFMLLLLLAGVMPAMPEEIHEYESAVGPFTKVKVLDNVNVVYRCLPDSSGFVQYKGAERFGDAFILNTNDSGTLRIQVSSEDIGDPELPVIYIYSDFLTSVENNSDFSLLVENPAPCVEFKATQVGNGTITVENVRAKKVGASINTGNGTVTLSGECENANFKMVGAGVIAADRLRAKTVDCKILGTGSIGCHPLDALSVKGIGSTKIYYIGNPTIKKSGGGKLIQLPSEPEGKTVSATVERIDVAVAAAESGEELDDETDDDADNQPAIDDEEDDEDGDEEDDSPDDEED